MSRKLVWVFFDLDGTLIDSLPALFNTYLDFLRKFDIVGTEMEFTELNGPSLGEIIIILKNRYQIPDGIPKLTKFYNQALKESFLKYVKPFADSDRILRLLSKTGYKLMLVTSAPKELAHELIEKFSWSQCFQDYVFGNEVDRGKPYPDIYRLALGKAAVEPKNVVAVEDSPNGTASACQAGVRVIGVVRKYSSEQLKLSGAHFTVTSLDEILRIMEDGSEGFS